MSGKQIEEIKKFQAPGDKFAWSTKKEEIDHTPRFTTKGGVYNVVYGAIETEDRPGKFGMQKLTKLQIKRNSNGDIGYILVNDTQFSEIAEKFRTADYPPTLVWVRTS